MLGMYTLAGFYGGTTEQKRAQQSVTQSVGTENEFAWQNLLQTYGIFSLIAKLLYFILIVIVDLVLHSLKVSNALKVVDAL